MANGRPTGDGSGRSPASVAAKSANEEGLSALGRQMRGGAEPGSVANESGLRALGRAHRRRRRPAPSADGAAASRKWSAAKKIVVALSAVLVLLVAAVGGGYAYLWYRYNQINKVHISAEVAAANGAPFTILVIGSDSPGRRVGRGGAGLRLGVGGHRPAQRRRAAVAGDAVHQADPGRLHPPRHRRLHAAAGHLQFGTYNRINSSYNTGADQLVKTITANFGIPINHVVQVDFSRLPGRRQRAGRGLPGLPLPGQGRLLGARHHDARLPAAQRRPGPGRGAGPPLRVLRERLLAVRRDE